MPNETRCASFFGRHKPRNGTASDREPLMPSSVPTVSTVGSWQLSDSAIDALAAMLLSIPDESLLLAAPTETNETTPGKAKEV